MASVGTHIKRLRTANELIGSGVFDRNAVNFGYTLFSGTGDPEELPEHAGLTLTGLLRLTARLVRK